MPNPPKISNEKLRETHNDLIGEMGLPPWAVEQKCVNCHQLLATSSIRGISLCTNARYLGDISVEVCCTQCSAGYEMHYRVNCLSLEDFIKHLTSATMPTPFVPDFNIPNWDNNLVRNILQVEESDKTTKKE